MKGMNINYGIPSKLRTRYVQVRRQAFNADFLEGRTDSFDNDLPDAVLESSTLNRVVIPQRVAFRGLEKSPEFRVTALHEVRMKRGEQGEEGWDGVGLVRVVNRRALSKKCDA